MLPFLSLSLSLRFRNSSCARIQSAAAKPSRLFDSHGFGSIGWRFRSDSIRCWIRKGGRRIGKRLRAEKSLSSFVRKDDKGGGVVGVCGSHAHAGRVHTDFSTASRIIVSVPVIAKLEPDDTTSANHSRIGVLRPATLPARSHGRCSSLPWEQVNLVNVIKDGTTKCLVACAGNDGYLLWKV